MKIVHTSDWHIGKIVNEFSMIEDQKYILNKLIELIELEKPKVVIIAGDVYDRSIPPIEAVELLNETLIKLVIEKNIKVLAISGNHDSGERLSFASEILEKNGLYISGNDEELYKHVVVNEDGKNINFYLVPYKDPALIRKILNEKDIKNHNDAMKYIVEKIEEEMNKNEINILVGHGYVTMERENALKTNKDTYEIAQLEISESERPLSIGGTDLIDGKIFNYFDYVALGHLHGRQKVGREEIKYSGSLLKYSFSEVNHKKGVYILNVKDKDNINIDFKDLKPLRDLRVIRGNIDELIKEARDLGKEKNDYIQAILTDDGELINPMEKLKAVYPNTMLITRERKRKISEDKTSAKGDYKKKSKLELFKEFYEDLGYGDYTKEKEEVLKDVINEVLKIEVK